MENIKSALVKALIVLIPSYTTAFLTDKMVYVIPMLAASGIVAATVSFPASKNLNRRTDEDESEQEQEPADINNNINEIGSGG